MKQKRLNGKNMGFALLTMIAGAFASCCLIGLLVGTQIIPEEMGPLISFCLTEILVMLVCYWAARKVPQSRLLASLIIAALFLGLRLLMGIVLFSGEDLHLTRCLAILAAAIAAGFMASTKKQRRR